MDTIGKKLALKEKMAYGSPPQQLALSAEGIIFPLFLYRSIIQLLSLHHTDRLNSDTSAADNFDMLELFFDKLDDRVIFGCGLDEFQKEAVFSIVDDTCLESLSNLEKFYFIFRGAALYLDVKDLLHSPRPHPAEHVPPATFRAPA